jgi:hypothetical protein
MNRTFLGVVATVSALGGVAHADANESVSKVSSQTTEARDFHIGLNFRTDFGARYYRADLGMRFGRWDYILVADPLGVQKGDYDMDAVVRYVGDRWSVWGGGRLSIVPIARSHQFTEKALVGVSTQLPSVLTDKVRIHAGLELAIHVHAHGADLMTNWVCVDSPDCREDHFVFGLFGRAEYASPF